MRKNFIYSSHAQKYLLGILVTWLGLTGCVPLVITSPYPPRQGERKEEKHEVYGIPKGHLPPPGHCRIRYPNRPAGQPPPPQRCPIAAGQIPLGAYVVSRIEGDNKRALVYVYSGQKPGVVVDTRYYNVTE